MRVAVLVVVAALLALAQAQPQTFVCTGYNVTTSIRDTQYHMCPYGYYTDTNQMRCVSYRDLVNNFLYTPCDIDRDCGPLAQNPDGSQPIMRCGVQKVCTWYQTRAFGDQCTVNTNCASYGSVSYGCSKYNKTCVRTTTVYTAQFLDRCNYQDYAEYVQCNPSLYYCDAISLGNCRPLLNLGDTCGAGIVIPCKTGLTCFNSTCSNLRQRGETCGIDSNCDQTPGTTICFQGQCSAIRTVGQSCQSNSQCDSTANLYCNGGSFLSIGTCTAYGQLNENCNSTYPCTSSLRCVTPTGVSFGNGVCLGPAAYNQTCGFAFGQNICAGNMTCVRGYCMNGDVGDQCNSVPDSCKTQNVCINNNVCLAKVGIGGNCTLSTSTNSMCFTGLLCYNKTCIAYQTAGQPCDPTGNLNPLNPLFCNGTLQCSRNVCIVPNSLSVGTLCSQDSDCDSSYCDPLIKKCTRRKVCTQSSTGCTCVCNAGYQNVGQCILDNCNTYKTKLYTCLANQGLTAITISASSAWLDSGSTFFNKCQNEHNAYVMCQATMAKWGAPNVPLGDLINYNLAAVSASSSLTASFMVIVAVVMSVLLML